MVIDKKILFALLFAAFASLALAQTNGSNSPYSRYGYGLLNDRVSGFNRGMSGLGYGMVNGAELNTKNPASYAHIDSLSFLFDIGVSLQNGNLESNGKKINAKNTALDYLSMGFRLSPHFGMSVGLLPFSTIGYSMSNTAPMQNAEDILQTDDYSGDGGLHEVYAGVAWRPIKNVSIGANVGYMWGDLSHTVLTSFSNAGIPSLRRQYASEIRTYKIDFGALYTQPMNKNNALTLGVTYGLGHDVNSDAEMYNQKVASGAITSPDTIVARDAYSLPHSVGVGLSWNYKGKLRVGVDYLWEGWADVKSPAVVENDNPKVDYRTATGNFTDRQKITFGCEYVPNPEGMRWRNHVRYRAGFSMASPYTKVNGIDGPKSYSVSLGASFPIRNFYSNRTMLNVSAQYEHVKPKMAGMITERYIRLSLGLSFNERWFMKWKVE